MRWAAAVLLLLLAGCVESDASVEFDQSGGAVDEAATTSCGDAPTLDLSVAVRSGALRVRVLDGDGAVAFNETYEETDGGETVRGLFGAPGTWRLLADASDFDGRLRASLSCR